MKISEQVKSLIKEISGVDKINIKKKLQDDLGIDSLGLITLLVEIEERFGFELEEADMDPFALQTVSDVIKLVEKYNEKKC